MSSLLNIKSWAEEDRPREKLLLKGRSVLSDAELIGILLGSGTQELTAVDLAKNILHQVNYDLHRLAQLDVRDLTKLKGIGEAKAISIIAALEIGRRRKEQESVKKPKIACSEDVFTIMKPDLYDIPYEEFWIILLNRANLVIQRKKISSGGVSGTVADPKMIYKYALENLASSLILIHNHPSGNLKPSEQDKLLTRKLKKAGEFLEIPVLDHVIFHNDGFYSFADEGIL